MLILALLIATAHAAPVTLQIDLTPNRGRATRIFKACQWVAADLTQQLKPDFVNVGIGSILRISEDRQLKVLGPFGKAVWQKADKLVAYKTNDPLIRRYAELEQKHGRRGFFYESPENVVDLLRDGTGFELKPGELIASTGDPALIRNLFAAPIVEFVRLRADVEDGVVVYRPTTEVGAIPLELLARSALTVFPTNIPTMTAQKQERKLARNCAKALKTKQKD